MRKMTRKRAAALLLALALCLGLAPWPASAAPDTSTLHGTVASSNGVLFVVNSKHELWAYCSDGTRIVSPTMLMTDVAQICSDNIGSSAVLKTDGTLWYVFFDKSKPACSIHSQFQIASEVKKITTAESEYVLLYLQENGTLWQGFFKSQTLEESRISQVASGIVDIAGKYCLTADGTVMGQEYSVNYSEKRIETDGLSKVSGLPAISSIYSIADAYFAIDTDGSLWSWGLNNCGQLGNGGAYEAVDNPGWMVGSLGHSFWERAYLIQSLPMKIMDHVTEIFGTDAHGYAEANGDLNAWCTMNARTSDGTLWQWADGGSAKEFIEYRDGNYYRTNKISMPEAMYLTPRVAPEQNLAYATGSASACSARIYQDGSMTASGFTALQQGSEINYYAIDQSLANLTTELPVGNRGPVSGTPAAPAVQTPNASGFVDVPEGKYYYEPVLWAVKNSITGGTGENTFSPERTCTKGEILTFLWRALGEPEGTADPFRGRFREDAYYYKPLVWAQENGVLSEDRQDIDPKDPCTRAAAVYYIWAALGRPGLTGQSIPPITDMDSADSRYPSVLWAMAADVTSGTGEGTFSPDRTCTRGEIVTFLYRAFNS